VSGGLVCVFMELAWCVCLMLVYDDHKYPSSHWKKHKLVYQYTKDTMNLK